MTKLVLAKESTMLCPYCDRGLVCVSERRPSIPLSILIGFGMFMLLVPLAPLTLLWVVGERYQGRTGIVLADREGASLKGSLLLGSTAVQVFVWIVIIIAVFLCG